MEWTTNAFELRTIADVCKDILTETWFVFESSKVTMTNVDPEKIVVVHLQLCPAEINYVCKERLAFPFYMQTLYRVLRGCKKTDKANVKLEKDSTVMNIRVYTEDGVFKNLIQLHALRKQFSEYQYMMDPNVDYDFSLVTGTEAMYKIFHDLSGLSRRIQIEIVETNLYFSAQDEGGTVNSFSIELDKRYTFRHQFITKYLEKFTKPCLTKELKLQANTHRSMFTLVYCLENGFLALTIAALE